MQPLDTAHPDPDSTAPSPYLSQKPPISSTSQPSTLPQSFSSLNTSITPLPVAGTHIPIPKRRRNTSGLLPLNVSITKTVTTENEVTHSPGTIQKHCRAQSLKLPLLVHTAFHAGRLDQSGATMPSEKWKAMPEGGTSQAPTKKAKESKKKAPEGLTVDKLIKNLSEYDKFLAQHAEVDLEYTHRNTYIGTASLDDFLSRLEIDFITSPCTPIPETTKDSIIEVFKQLSQKERGIMETDSCINRPESGYSGKWQENRFPEWQWATPTKIKASPVAQAQIKLGTISLHDFLDELSFYCDCYEPDVDQVVAAFNKCSQKDRDGEYDGRKNNAGRYRTHLIPELLKKRKEY